MSGTPPVALTVAGTDSGGAAGVPADLATFAALGVHGACAVTAVTAQDTTGVHAVQRIDTAIVAAQIDAVLDDLPVGAVKTGMLGTPEVVALVAERLAGRPGRPLVVDPVLVATSGAVLGDPAVVRAYGDLLPQVSVLTPNLDEARALLGAEGATGGAEPRELAGALAALGCGVVLTGGPPPHAAPDAGRDREAACIDWWCPPGGLPEAIAHPLVATRNDHGTGCTYSAAVAALLAAGCPVPEALGRAAAFTAARLHGSQGWRLGRGRGPVAHLLADPTDDTAPTPRRTP